jgi:hypothetical protein
MSCRLIYMSSTENLTETIEIPQNLATSIDAYAAARSMTRNTAAAALIAQALEAGGMSVDTGDLPARITAAYRTLAPRPDAWVSLTELRPLIADVDHHTLSTELVRLHVARDIQLIPEENRRSITTADRAAAVIIGDEPRHLMSISR